MFLKGERCESPKCALFRKQQAPGQHGTPSRRPSEYALQLRAKQRVKRLYGVSETQFRRYFKEASASKEFVGKTLLQLLERRLDNAVFRAGFAVSRPQARQLVTHKKVSVNGTVVDRPSFLVSIGDKITFANGLGVVSNRPAPGWLVVNEEGGEVLVKAIPSRDDIGLDIDENLVVEYYSR